MLIKTVNESQQTTSYYLFGFILLYRRPYKYERD